MIHPSGENLEWSMPLDRLADYVAEIRQAGEASSDLRIRLGIEADFFPETVERLRSILQEHPFDYVIGSVHFVGDFPIDSSRQPWDALSIDGIDEMWRRYWDLIRRMAESRVYDFAAHLDLPKKFGFRPKIDLTAEAGAALDALAAAEMAIEINTAGWSLPAKEAYPSLPLLEAARERGIPLLINADAHQPDHLTRDFDRARELARQAGYAELVRYECRRRFPVPL